jgi:hypothetical protein
VSRAAKGADCKSAGLRLRRFESYLSHHLKYKEKFHSGPFKAGHFCVVCVVFKTVENQVLPLAPGDSARHTTTHMVNQRDIQVTPLDRAQARERQLKGRRGLRAEIRNTAIAKYVRLRHRETNELKKQSVSFAAEVFQVSESAVWAALRNVAK